MGELLRPTWTEQQVSIASDSDVDFEVASDSEVDSDSEIHAEN